jgi:GT2 family glycosyltransferase
MVTREDARPLVVIPAYGLVELTRAVVSESMRESSAIDVLVVDNGGDYEAIANEEVLRPGENLGWLRACNLGMRMACERGCRSVILLNNDTRLSQGFFAGLLDASRHRPNAILAPLYDDEAVPAQQFASRAPGYSNEGIIADVLSVDGTCMLIPTRLIDSLGFFDERHFGRRGWGADVDYCLRARREGFGVAVTRASFLTHARGATAHTIGDSYERFAKAEMEIGLTIKYGRHWREKVEPERFASRRRGELLIASSRYLEDRLRLSPRTARWLDRVVTSVAARLPSRVR